MSDNLTAVFLAFFVIVVPLWIILHYFAKFRGAKRLSTADAAAFEQLSATATRIEQRLAMLERILDMEAPGWRQTAAMGDPQHGPH